MEEKKTITVRSKGDGGRRGWVQGSRGATTRSRIRKVGSPHES